MTATATTLDELINEFLTHIFPETSGAGEPPTDDVDTDRDGDDGDDEVEPEFDFSDLTDDQFERLAERTFLVKGLIDNLTREFTTNDEEMGEAEFRPGEVFDAFVDAALEASFARQFNSIAAESIGDDEDDWSDDDEDWRGYFDRLFGGS